MASRIDLRSETRRSSGRLQAKDQRRPSTTAATILATVLAERGASVAVIDADPNKNVVDWSHLPGKPANLSVTGEVGEETIVDAIEEAAGRAAFVIVDLEGAANLLVSYAISLADFVVIPMQGSQLDAKQAARQMKLIASQERISGRSIPFAVLMTRVSPAIQPKTQRHIEDRFRELAVPVLETRLYDREAFRAIFSFGGSVAGLADKGVSNLTAAIANADAFAGEIVEHIARPEAGGRLMSDRADPLGDLAEFKPGPTAPTPSREDPRRLRAGGLSLEGAASLADRPQHAAQLEGERRRPRPFRRPCRSPARSVRRAARAAPRRGRG